MNLLAAALEYAGYGWHVVKLHHVLKDGSCSCGRGSSCPQGSRGKHPVGSRWQDAATTDEDAITQWWEDDPDANIGLLLGPKSGIVDIEFDDETGRKTADELMGACFTPTYSSGRSVHRLFRWSPDLPATTVPKINGLEFRLGNSKAVQSVAPPSMHHSGKRYEWLPGLSPSEVGVEDIPPRLILMLQNPELNTEVTPRKAQSKLYTQEKVVETVDGRDDTLYREACRQWSNERRLNGDRCLDDPDIQGRVWTQIAALNLFKCVPPLEEAVVLQKVESARKFILSQADDAKVQHGVSLTNLGLERRDGEWFPGQWSLTVVHSDPAQYLLNVPAFTDLCGGVVRLSLEDFSDPRRVAAAVLAATKKVVLDDEPGRWPAIWNGTIATKTRPGQRGLKAKLMDRSTVELTISDNKRSVIVADKLGEAIEKAATAAHPDPRGRPTRMEDGTIWLRWDAFWSDLKKFKDVTDAEVLALSRAIGISRRDGKYCRDANGETRRRYIVLGPTHLHRLAQEREMEEDHARV